MTIYFCEIHRIMNTLKKALTHTKIKQQFFINKSLGDLKEVFGDTFYTTLINDYHDDILNHYVIYIDDIQPHVVLHLYGDHISEESLQHTPKLKDILLQLPEINYAYLLFALSLYIHFDRIDMNKFIQTPTPFAALEEYDDLLSSTHGYVLYKYQFEQLIARISNDITQDPVRLRKGWNKKLHTTMEDCSQLMVTNKVNLTTFLRERTIEENHFVFSPSHREAQLLYNYLLQKKSIS